MRRAILAAFLLMAPLLPASAAQAAPVITGAPTVGLVIDWEMPERFGIDEDGDGLVDLPNTVEYVHGRMPGSCPSGCRQALFPIRLLAQGVVTAPTSDGSRIGLPIASYEWRIRGQGLDLHRWSSRPELALVLPEGEYSVALTLRAKAPFGTVTLRTFGTAVVDDILVVALGDSYASGDGNPEVPDAGAGELWAEGGVDAASDADHADARRSTVAWPSRVAMALERTDRRTSVTFVSLATSGATIDGGVAGPDSGRPPQVRQAGTLVGARRVDLVLLSIGGNDVGFSEVVRALVDADPLLDPVCYDLDVEHAFASAVDGDWTRDTTARYRAPFSLECRATTRNGKQLPGLAGLGAAFDRLASALTGLDASRVVITEYPDPSGGGTCSEIVGDAVPWPRLHEIDRPEQAAGIAGVLEPLNRTIADAARRHDWTLVSGIAAAFADGHAYCASWPDYGYP
ncbi:MAG TPA: SGNH/GDSL hydrolase family protein, partial [Acidimicrobiia bacterium]|nr:SGNH/GDSL hydrolase family protein [Acidimicrobiia bacterium]